MRRARFASVVVCAVACVACTGGHSRGATTTTRPLDPFGSAGGGTTTSSAGAPQLTPSALAVGQCFDTDTFRTDAPLDLAGAHVVDCAGPHQHEVYAVEVEPSGPDAPYPGDVAIAAFADDRCLADFAGYTGVDFLASHFDIANARPDEKSWAGGERHVVCALHDQDFAPLVGSARAR